VFVPMILLYHFSILLCRIFIRPPRPEPVTSVGV